MSERPVVRQSRHHPLLRLVERLFILIAVVALGYCAWSWLEATLYQAYENRELERILTSAPQASSSSSPATATRARRIPPPGTTLGRIEIARLGVSAVVRTGSDARTLQLAVGHIPGTALPGERGNVGLAGHRDTFFRRLRDIAADDRIRILTPEGTFTYRVQRTDIVAPSDVWVLGDTPEPSLTLVTCYPFSYIGSAPERFIVRAVLERPGAMASTR
jgi:sortase A